MTSFNANDTTTVPLSAKSSSPMPDTWICDVSTDVCVESKVVGGSVGANVDVVGSRVAVGTNGVGGMLEVGANEG